MQSQYLEEEVFVLLIHEKAFKYYSTDALLTTTLFE